MPVTFDQTIFASAQSETGTYALNSFTGTALLSGATPVTLNGTIDTPGSTVGVNLNAANLTAVGAVGTYLGYSPADANGNYVYYFNVTGGGLATPVTIGVTSAAALPALNTLTAVNTSNVTAPVCFVTGTRIRTPDGDVAVEELRVGDAVVTASGAHRPILWIGRRDMALGGADRRREALPIRIRAGAVGEGLPVRDLLVSPGHRLLIDGVLVQAAALANGLTIVREAMERVTYWHVELESHDVLLAEGLPAESYVEAANRASFDNGDVVFGRRPVISLVLSQPSCAPLVDEGPQLELIRRRLAARARSAERVSHDTSDPAIQLLADGEPLTPHAVFDGMFEFAVPDGTRHLALRSRSAVPARTQSGSTDRRRLGVCVSALHLDGQPVPIDDPRIEIGWHEPEADASFRWTTGVADLPVARRLAFRAMPLPAYEPHRLPGGEARRAHR